VSQCSATGDLSRMTSLATRPTFAIGRKGDYVSSAPELRGLTDGHRAKT
jgi:hypothetical protein